MKKLVFAAAAIAMSMTRISDAAYRDNGTGGPPKSKGKGKGFKQNARKSK